MIPKTAALLLIAGRGERLGSTIPKQFMELGDKRLYLHALHTLESLSLFSEILLVCEKEWSTLVEQETSSFHSVRIVEGGSTRQHSSFLGLQALSPQIQFVFIHDGVRPFVSKEIIQANLQAVAQYGAVDTCIPSSDTLVYAPDPQILSAIPPRAHYLRGQTPQTFSYPLILEAHRQALSKGITNATDDCSLVAALGAQIAIVPGEELNFKITTALDFQLAESLLLSNRVDTATQALL